MHHQPNPDWGVECAADACVTSHQYELAALGYYKLDAAEPRIASKVAYCEWMLGHDEEAFNRLTSLGEELDADGEAF
ncbi:hypothetical protein [Paraburkholderia sp. MM5384-R2]|uniref:hypothetical protein n=1 Tax=Paraburkholderia sp. MM5384-R2 TaxID=2723097 RepID=UPI001613CB9C|nr:hypothetical protein [Paraburkholderia sp. MM5384-R2]MBB5496457.1 hypothetical protein [Paraburkholderia sp. MM5384-R2]